MSVVDELIAAAKRLRFEADLAAQLPDWQDAHRLMRAADHVEQAVKQLVRDEATR